MGWGRRWQSARLAPLQGRTPPLLPLPHPPRERDAKGRLLLVGVWDALRVKAGACLRG